MTNNNDAAANGFQNRPVHNLIVLDESGSMEAIKIATITGFNELVQTIKGMEKQFPEQQHFVSLVTFNALGVKNKLFNKTVKSLKEIDERSFQPDASTPLFDAIGFSINKLRRAIEKQKNSNVLVTILTDGEENASEEYTGAAVKNLFDEMKQHGWTFTYIGANHDVERVAFSLSIHNHLKFEANAWDIKRAFDVDKRARILYSQKMRRNEDLQADYFKDVEDESDAEN